MWRLNPGPGALPRAGQEWHHLSHETTKEDTIARAGKTTMAKRDREKSLQTKRKEKEEKRAQRKGEKDDRTSIPAGEDPDLEGLQWGPQPPLY
jgi:hypothetical protein